MVVLELEFSAVLTLKNLRNQFLALTLLFKRGGQRAANHRRLILPVAIFGLPTPPAPTFADVPP